MGLEGNPRRSGALRPPSFYRLQCYHSGSSTITVDSSYSGCSLFSLPWSGLTVLICVFCTRSSQGDMCRLDPASLEWQALVTSFRLGEQPPGLPHSPCLSFQALPLSWSYRCFFPRLHCEKTMKTLLYSDLLRNALFPHPSLNCLSSLNLNMASLWIIFPIILLK